MSSADTLVKLVIAIAKVCYSIHSSSERGIPSIITRLCSYHCEQSNWLIQKTTTFHLYFRLFTLELDKMSLSCYWNSISPHLHWHKNLNFTDLLRPKLEPTAKVLGAFEGQLIHQIGYFQTTVQHQDDPDQSSLMKIYVCHSMWHQSYWQGWEKL